MTRKHFRMIALAAVIALVTLVASAATVHAQNQKCCTYTVVVRGISDKCLPFKVISQWDGVLDAFLATANGIYIQKVPGKCPPPPNFDWVQIDQGPKVGLGETIKYVDPGTGCCYVISVSLDADGCILIVITPC